MKIIHKRFKKLKRDMAKAYNFLWKRFERK